MAESGSRTIDTVSVSRDVVETEPIVLRETSTRRLVFLPKLIDSPDPLRGYFVYQRKTAVDSWDDLRTENLNSLRSGEGWALELHSKEVSTLLEGLQARRDLYERHGIRWGERQYVEVGALPEVVRALVNSPDGEVADALNALTTEQVVALGRRVDLSQLDKLLDIWLGNAGRVDEDFWQQLLAANAWVFAQLTGAPVVLLQEKAYVGGKGIENTGGGEIDFLVRNSLTDNVAFVEIKTPTTPLSGGPYRTSGAYSLHKELSGGIVQVLGYRDSFKKAFNELRASSSPDVSLKAYRGRCVLIAGTVASLNDDEKRSFELLRGSLTDVQLWTFDEVASRLRGIRDALAAPSAHSA